MPTLLSRVLVLVAVTLGCVAGWMAARSDKGYSWATQPADMFAVEGERELGILAPGEYPVEFAITNTTRTEQRIIGNRVEPCGLVGCMMPVGDVPSGIVAPGATVRVRCKVLVRGPGEFETKMFVFLDDHGMREVKLVARGVGVAPTEVRGHDAAQPTASSTNP